MIKLEFKKAEIVFILIGFILVITSASLLFSEKTFYTDYLNYTTIQNIDFFKTTYKKSNLVIDSNITQSGMASNYTPTKNDSIYLFYPSENAEFTKTGSTESGYPIRFSFEVEPKNIPATFILKFNDQIAIQKKLKLNQTGKYQVSILIKKSGFYTWQVVTPYARSDSRSLKIK